MRQEYETNSLDPGRRCPLPPGITIKDMNRRILYANQTESAVHGSSQKELTGQKENILGTPEDSCAMYHMQIRNMTSWRNGKPKKRAKIREP